ncbi:MAG: glycoside hydrolase family 57 protein [Phycisphaeraceae bacterium]
MASVCFYFQVHQPHRLRRYSVFDAHARYFDRQRNREILRTVAQKCYLPATETLLRLIHRHEGAMRVAFSLTGCVLEQLEADCPEVLDNFRRLAETGCCEFLGETYYHSLAFLYSQQEFREQVELHADLVEDLFGQVPSVFRFTELIYNNELGRLIAEQGRYRGILAEGVDANLGERSPDHLYTAAGHPEVDLLLRNYSLSDDVAFRFSDPGWNQWPLTADRYADWIQAGADRGSELFNLFMDFETFGERQHKDSGIFPFLDALPGRLIDRGLEFRTPSECIETCKPVGEYDVPEATSWADSERDLSAWRGNAMQSSALAELYRLEEKVKQHGDDELIADWRCLTSSDHFYYMCTKFFEDGEVHRYFNAYESPYDSYINFMNVLDNLRSRVEAVAPA